MLYPIVCLLILSHCLRSFRPQQRQLKKTVSMYFYLQPFQGSKISINNRRTQFQKISIDKTLGFLKIKVPLYTDHRLGFFLSIKNKNFRTIQREIFLQGKNKNWLKKPPFFVLDKKKQQASFPLLLEDRKTT